MITRGFAEVCMVNGERAYFGKFSLSRPRNRRLSGLSVLDLPKCALNAGIVHTSAAFFDEMPRMWSEVCMNNGERAYFGSFSLSRPRNRRSSGLSLDEWETRV